LGAKKEFCHYDLQILYEDQDVIVIYKPTGLLSVATENEVFRTAHDYLKRRSPNRRVFPVHRLDKDTSGVMVFAYNQDAKAHLKDQFEAHTIHREYRAILSGHLTDKKGKWESFLIEDSNYKMHECQEKEGAQLAITFYEVLQETRRLSLVKFVLKTGKKNQIRVQAAQRGHPVIGDTKYGLENDTFPRLALHAMVLEFIHPKKNKKLSFSYPFPKELAKLFACKS
jgi:23S rRNA pseudouridine1911/1915/1917 synthase